MIVVCECVVCLLIMIVDKIGSMGSMYGVKVSSSLSLKNNVVIVLRLLLLSVLVMWLRIFLELVLLLFVEDMFDNEVVGFIRKWFFIGG